ncbi:hypothetical protein EPN52_09165 [bacterium]|nr:MAG: hypothetical protein EPN52_09165 [bacterium]
MHFDAKEAVVSVAIVPACRRETFLAWYAENRRRSERIFDLAVPQAHLSRPIPLRHPIVFYEGHLPAFSYITLVRKALGGPPIDADLERLFQRGIDPADTVGAQRSQPAAWPPRDRIRDAAARWHRTRCPSRTRYRRDFDGEHYVVKGASPVTARSLIRRSFRNWYRTNYPYVYAKFRCAYD